MATTAPCDAAERAPARLADREVAARGARREHHGRRARCSPPRRCAARRVRGRREGQRRRGATAGRAAERLERWPSASARAARLAWTVPSPRGACTSAGPLPPGGAVESRVSREGDPMTARPKWSFSLSWPVSGSPPGDRAGAEARQGRQGLPGRRAAHHASRRGEDLRPQGQGRPGGVPEDLLGAARPRPRDAEERVQGGVRAQEAEVDRR